MWNNRWVVGVLLTAAVIVGARRAMRGHSGGDYNFMPAIAMSIAFVIIVAIWLVILLSGLV